MDIGANGGFGGFAAEEDEQRQRPQPLPDDLPTSLDDRRSVPTHYTAETEMYDAWQGEMLHLCSVPCQTLIPNI